MLFTKDGRKIVTDAEKDGILATIHGGQLGGHLGVTKCYGKIKPRYFWPGMFEDLRRFIGESNAPLLYP